MKKTLTIIIILAAITAVVLLVRTPKTPVQPTQPLSASQSITGCYAEKLAGDIYMLDITSEQGSSVSGTLAFDNAEKDSSHGTFVGTYANGILLADYSFSSEGMDSVRQVVFKKTDTGFIEGFGPTTVTNNRESLEDPASATFDSTQVFVPSDSCTNI